MAISMAAFTLNDTLMKHAFASVDMGQAMLVRGLFAVLLIFGIAVYQGALPAWRGLFHRTVLVRATAELGATLTFLAALTQLPLANVSAVLQALPLAVTMGAALAFGEPVGWRRWMSIVAGFIGVLIVVRPGMEGFSPYALLVLLCVGLCTVRDLATRQVPKEVPSILVSVVAAIAVTACGAVLVGPTGGWSPMSPGVVAQLAGAAALVVVGYQFIIQAMRTGDISFIAPFRYSALLWAVLLGFVVFGDVPDLPMSLGASIIVASGLYMLYRERLVSMRKPAAGSTSPAMAPDGL